MPAQSRPRARPPKVPFGRLWAGACPSRASLLGNSGPMPVLARRLDLDPAPASGTRDSPRSRARRVCRRRSGMLRPPAVRVVGSRVVRRRARVAACDGRTVASHGTRFFIHARGHELARERVQREIDGSRRRVVELDEPATKRLGLAHHRASDSPQRTLRYAGHPIVGVDLLAASRDEPELERLAAGAAEDS